MSREVIRDAIRRRQRLLLDYEPGRRTVEPHVLGRGKDRQLLLRCYQTEGASASGEHENWKLFRLDRMNGVAASGESFPGPRPKYNPDDPVMKGGIVERL